MRRKSCPNVTTISMSQRRLRAQQMRAKKQATLDAQHALQQATKKQRIKQLRLKTLKNDCQMRRQYSLQDGKALCKYCHQWFPETLFEDHIIIHPTRVRQRIWLGNANNARDMEVMHNCKITHILNCTKEIKLPTVIHSYIKSVKRIAIQDKTCETIMNYCLDVCQYIEKCLSESQTHVLLIHCREGRSRSVSFLCMYLMWKEKVSFHAALSDIRSKRYIVLPNSKFYHELELFDAELNCDHELSPKLKKFGVPESFTLKKANACVSNDDNTFEKHKKKKKRKLNRNAFIDNSKNNYNAKYITMNVEKRSTNVEKRNTKIEKRNSKKRINGKKNKIKKFKKKNVKRNAKKLNSKKEYSNNTWINFQSDPCSLLELENHQNQTRYDRKRSQSLSNIEKVQLKLEPMDFYHDHEPVMASIAQSPNTVENRVSNQIFEYEHVIPKKQKKKKKRIQSSAKYVSKSLNISDLAVPLAERDILYHIIANMNGSMKCKNNVSKDKQRSNVYQKSKHRKRKKEKRSEIIMANAIRKIFQ